MKMIIGININGMIKNLNDFFLIDKNIKKNIRKIIMKRITLISNLLILLIFLHYNQDSDQFHVTKLF